MVYFSIVGRYYAFIITRVANVTLVNGVLYSAGRLELFCYFIIISGIKIKRVREVADPQKHHRRNVTKTTLIFFM